MTIIYYYKCSGQIHQQFPTGFFSLSMYRWIKCCFPVCKTLACFGRMSFKKWGVLLSYFFPSPSPTSLYMHAVKLVSHLVSTVDISIVLNQGLDTRKVGAPAGVVYSTHMVTVHTVLIGSHLKHTKANRNNHVSKMLRTDRSVVLKEVWLLS